MQPNELIQALREADQQQRQEIKRLLSNTTRKRTRRGVMTAGAGILSWLAIGQAAGQSSLPRSSCEWFGHVDANGYNLQNLNALEGTGLTGGQKVTNIAGTNLTIDSNGNLNASGGGGGGALTDSGTDTDGGDDYVLPNAADNIDLQSDGSVQNADSVSTASGTVDGDTMIGFPSSSSPFSISFGAWTTVDSNNPTLALISLRADTNGSGDGLITVDVDESGGTSADYTIFEPKVQGVLDAGDSRFAFHTVPLPPGGQIRINNVLDPAGANVILATRKVVL